MVGFNPYHLSSVSGVQRAQWWPGYLSWSCSSANNSTKSDKSLDFSMLPLPYLFRLQPSVAYCVPAWHSRTLPEFYFSTLGGSVSLGSDVSFHSIVYAVRLAPLKLGWLPQVLRNRGTAWEVLGRTFSQRCLRNIEQGLVPLLRRSGCLPTLHLDLKCQPICPGSYWRLAHLVPRWKFPTEPGSRRRPNDGLWRLFPIGRNQEGRSKKLNHEVLIWPCQDPHSPILDQILGPSQGPERSSDWVSQLRRAPMLDVRYYLWGVGPQSREWKK